MKPLSGLLLTTGRTVLVASAIAGAAFAQTETGLIEGRVIDSTAGQNLQGAQIRVLGSATRAETGRDGTFTLRNLAPGAYEIEVSYLGF